MILESLFGRKWSSNWDAADNRWYSSMFLGRSTRAGVNVSEESAFTYSVVWAATRMLSGTGAWLPVGFYRQVDENRREWDASQPALPLMKRKASANTKAFSFRSLLINWQVNRGNGYAEIQWGYNPDGATYPVALWPIHPTKCRVAYDEDGSLHYMVRMSDGLEKRFERENIFHVQNTITADGDTGLGVIAHARETIGGALGAEREAHDSFGSGHMPRIVVESDKTVNADERLNFRKEWKEIHSDGGDNVALLTGGAKAKPLSLNHEEMQFLESRQFTVEEMARWYGVPAHMIGQLSGVKYNSAEMLGIEFVTYSFIQLMTIWEQEIVDKLISPEQRPDHFVKFNFNGLMRGDSTTRAAYYSAMINNGIYTFNEVRALEDLNPVDGGDMRVIQGAMATINPDGTTNAPAGSKDTGSEGGPRPVDDDESPVKSELSGKLKVAARTMLHGALARMVQRESLAVKRAAQKPQKFIGWLDEFYTEHEPILKDAVQPVMMACEAFGMTCEPGRWANALCLQSKSRLLTLSGEVTADQLPGAVDALMADWERSRAESIVAGIAELN